MNENELALKTMELWSDLIKVGIPSIIAIVSTIASVYMGVKTTKIRKESDEKIEELKFKHDVQKSISTKQTNLIDEISKNISMIHDKFRSYFDILAGQKKFKIIDKKIEAASIKTHVMDAYAELSDIRNLYFHKTKSLTRLLNNKEISKHFDGLNTIILSSINDCPPNTTKTLEEVLGCSAAIEPPMDRIFKSLSNLYFATTD